MAVCSTFRRYVRILKIGAYKQKIKNNKLLNVDASNNFEIMDPLSVEQIKKIRFKRLNKFITGDENV